MDTDDFLKLLLKRQSELKALAETGAEAAQTVELDQARVGRLSRMDALQGQAMSQEAGRRREQELMRISKALKRLELGEFGECLSCDEEIAIGRLKVDPAATLCIRCAESAGG
ncbi:MAG: TraR/DksA C4-type zinc finger protein [Gammaproteobacteria bacterium]|nr:TraR/DksA C4-type zinc finger protein [Gammaproteobacteria bacterium]